MKGRHIAFTVEQLAFIEALHAIPREALHAEFVHVFQRDDVKPDHIKSLCTRRGWTTRARWTPEEDAVLRAQYPHIATARVAEMLQRKVAAVYVRAHAIGLAKSAAYLASPDACRLRRGDNTGAQFRYPKGHAPANKGLRRPGFAPGRMRETQFKKGSRNGRANAVYKPIGTIRMSKDGYQEIKVHEGLPMQSRWRAVHLVNWEGLNGPIPKGHALKNLDGNRQNTDPANWLLVSRSMLPRLNGGRAGRLGLDQAPEVLKPALIAIAQVEHAARLRKRKRAA